MTVSELEMILANRLERAGLPSPEAQFRFCPSRRFRADFAYTAERLLIEVDGGTWTQGRHARGSGIETDAEKVSLAAALGYRVIRLTRTMIESGRAVELIAAALCWPEEPRLVAPAAPAAWHQAGVPRSEAAWRGR